MAPFCMNTAQKSSGGGPLDPSSNTNLLDPITHINTEKINIKTFQQLNTVKREILAQTYFSVLRAGYLLAQTYFSALPIFSKYL